MKTTEKTGKVIAALVVHEEDSLMLMTTSGQSVRIPVNQIRETGRNAQGVKLLSLKGDELLRDIAKVITEKEEEIEIEAEGESSVAGEPTTEGDAPDDGVETPTADDTENTEE
jgi:DNA gyrase subunit A